jgi:hypothetical protein
MVTHLKTRLSLTPDLLWQTQQHIIMLLFSRFFVELCLIIAASVNAHETPSQSDPVLRLRVSVAQCRAICLHQSTGFRMQPAQEEDECWSACGRLVDVADVESQCRGGTEEVAACGPGCRRACRFYLNQNAVPSAKTGRLRTASPAPVGFSTLPTLQGCQLTWGRPELSANSLTIGGRQQPASVYSRPVYLLLGLDGAGQWYEVNQTEETQTRIVYQTLAKLHDLLLVAVGRQGIFTSAQVHVSEMAIQACRPGDLQQQQQQHQQQLSLPVLQKLESDGVLFRAVISWTSPAVPASASSTAAAQYLVRWRTIPEGFLAGSLLTNATTATLALLADSMVQVEVSPLILLDNRQLVTSPPLLISTYRPATTVGPAGTPGAAAALLVAVFSLLLSVAAFLAMIIRLFCSRRSDAAAAEDIEVGPTNNINNSNISNSSNNNNSKMANEDSELPRRPLSPCLLQAKNLNSFKFPVNKMNFNEKLNTFNTEQSST